MQFKVFFKNFESESTVLALAGSWADSVDSNAVEFRLVEGDNLDDFKAQIDSKTKAICAYLLLILPACSTEPDASADIGSIGNPAYNIHDIQKVADLAHANKMCVASCRAFL